MSVARIESSRLVLDSVVPSDVERVLEFCVDEELQRWVPLPVPYQRSDAEFFTGPYAASTGATFGLWAIRLSDGGPIGGALVGAIELRFEPLKSATIGFWLGRPHRGQGIMTEAVQTLVEYAFDPQGLDLDRIRWDAVAGNWASAIVARRNGFRYEGLSRLALVHRTQRVDGWFATLLRSDDRSESDGWPL